MPETRRINGVSALEMTMRDVLDNMADFGIQAAYDAPVPGGFEILAVEPAETPDPAPEEAPPPVYREPAPVVSLARHQEREVA